MSANTPSPAASLMAAARSDPGKRENNEDVSVLVGGADANREAGDLLFGVVDGMGGYQAGEVAAALARDTLYTCFAGGGTDVGRWIAAAHRVVLEDADAHPERQSMGAVLTAGVLSGDSLTIGHVGDTRMYRYRRGVLEQLTQDQSATGELIRSGHLTKEHARTHHMSNVVYQAVGHAERPPEPSVETIAVERGDLFLVNSDGLTDVITDDQIAAVLGTSATLDDAAENLIAAALEDQEAEDVNARPVTIPGGRDNITVVLVSVGPCEGHEHGGGGGRRSLWRRLLHVRPRR